MSKIRLISKTGDALALLGRLADEGNGVSFWVKDKKAKDSYKGMLPQVDSWNSKLSSKDTIILLDMVGFGAIADNLKKNGFKVYGGGKLNDSLELNREFGMKIARSSGLKVPKWERFNSFDKAKDFVADNEKSFVFKPQNNQSPAFTYVSSDGEDMVEMLAYFGSIWSGKVDFILQEKIEGVEVSIERFYLDGEPVPNTLNSTLECKKFLEGDKGVNTGCMGSVVRFWKKPNPKLYKLTLQKAEPFLKRFKYSGPLDCNCIICEKDKMPYFLEWTARFGYNALSALCEGLNQDVGSFIEGILNGGVSKPSYDWLGAVRVSIPPYPSELGADKSANKPIRGIDDMEHIWLLDVKYQNGRLLSAGVDGVVAEVTGKNTTLSGLATDIYGIVEKMKIPDKQYRADIISNAEKRINILKEWKYV